MSSVITQTPYNPTLPLQVPGLALWLDAADANSFTQSSGSVTSVRDKSPLNNTIITTSGFRLTNSFNGTYPAFTTASTATTGSLGRINTFTLSNPCTIFFVGQNTGLSSGTSTFPYVFDSGSGANRSYAYSWNQTTSPGLLRISAGVNIDAITSVSTVIPHTLSLTMGSSSTGLYQNGNFINNSGITGSNTTAIFIGGGGAAGTWTGFFSEFIIFNLTLTTAQRQQMEGYLAWKWGLQANLPANHPYYTNPFYPNALATPLPKNTTENLFLPTTVPGCALWLDAADSSVLFQDSAGTIRVTNNSQIQLWKDKSGNNNNASNTQTTILYSSSLFNSSYPTISFPGTQTTGFSLNGALLPNGNSDASYFFILRKQTSAVQVYFTHGLTATNLKQFYATSSLAIDKAGVALINDTGVNIVNQNIIVSCTETSLANGVNGWRNGTAFTTTGATTTWNVGTTAAWLGSGGDGGTSFIYNGYISEVIIYNRALTVSQRQQMEGYLAWKWGIQANLPSTHPFYFNRIAPIPVAIQTPAMFIQTPNWSPTSLSGLSLWLDAADAATVQFSSGANISNWRDKSGNERNATQGTTINQPSIGSRSVVFDTNKLLTTTYTSFPPSETIFIVLNVFSATNGVEGQLLQTSAVGGRQFGLNTLRLITAKFGVGYLIGLGAGGTLTSNTPTLVGSTNDGSQIFHYINGSVTGTNLSITPYSGTGTTLIGNTSGLNTGLVGYINEILTYSNTLSVNQRQQVEGYLAWKWGIRSSLPSTHPNYYIPVS